jgi:hypothetical protein
VSVFSGQVQSANRLLTLRLNFTRTPSLIFVLIDETMGEYVNPSDGDVEGWLNRNGREVRDFEYSRIPNGWLPVILHDLVIRKTAAIVYDENELPRELNSTLNH